MEYLKKAKELIDTSSNIVAFTGAGASTESDIPDFRSNNGLYNNENKKYDYPPEVMLSHSFFMEHTELFYEYYRSNMIYSNAKPNNCHLSLAELEKQGKLKAVITQNIDGLHQAAGSCNVLELHGSVQHNFCMNCRKEFRLEYIINSEKLVPYCDKCGGIIKPDVVLYEEMLDQNILSRAIKAVEAADVLLVIGTSLVVYPAAGLIDYYRGNKLILINKSATPFDTRAQVVINRSAGETMRTLL